MLLLFEDFRQLGKKMNRQEIKKEYSVTHMRGIVIYDTSYENTKIIAETIAETLKESGLDVHLSHVKDVKELHARDHDFLVLGSPTRINNMSFAASRFISGKIRGEEWKDKPFASFDTELPDVIQKSGASAAEKIAKKLSEKGLKQVLPVLKIAVIGIKGPLKEGEIENTRKYAEGLASELKGK